MRARSASVGRNAPDPTASIDIVLMALRGRQLCALASRDDSSGRGDLSLPWGRLARREDLDDAASRVAIQAAGTRPGWMEQAGAFTGGGHPAPAVLSVCFVAAVPWFEPAGTWQWTPALAPTGLPERQRRMVRASLGIVRHRTEHSPIAFRLLPKAFTLSELQRVYEGLLGRRLHKASFRRSLQASWMIEPLNEWRGEGRGRPAQLFRYAPRRRTGPSRGVRFEHS